MCTEMDNMVCKLMNMGIYYLCAYLPARQGSVEWYALEVESWHALVVTHYLENINTLFLYKCGNTNLSTCSIVRACLHTLYSSLHGLFYCICYYLLVQSVHIN